MNIPKYLSQQGLLSRREAESLLERGLITCNGTVVKNPALKIDPTKARIELLPAALRETSSKITIAYHKPRGVESDPIPSLPTLNTVGRLDKDSEGLLFLSNDGVTTATITHKDHLVEKEYQVSVREKILPTHIRQMEAGIKLNDGLTLPAKDRRTSPNTFNIILKEGRKHQIRRMAEALRLTVTSLKRIRIGPILLGQLKSGAYRPLTQPEIAEIKNFRYDTKIGG